MHSDAVYAGIGRSVAYKKEYHSRSLLPKSATVIAVGYDKHALAEGLAIIISSIVGKIKRYLLTFRSAYRL